MRMAFHVGVHSTDGDRLLKTLLKNRDWLLRNKTEVVTPNRHRGLFEEALMSLKGGPATPEMVDIMLDAILESDSPERIIFSSPTFMGAPGRAVGRDGLYPQIGMRAAALASLFPDVQTEFFLAIRNPATLLSDLLPTFTGGDYHTLMQGRKPLDLRWRDAIRKLIAALPGRRIVIWCHEDVPLIWPEILRLIADLPEDVPLAGGLLYIEEVLGADGIQKLQAALASRDQLTVSQRREICAQALQEKARDGAMDQDIILPGWSQDLVDQVTRNYRADVAEIAVLPGVEFILPR